MEIFVNGQPQTVATGYTSAQLVADMGLTGKRVAMEVNQEIVPRSGYERHILHDGDKIEIVHAVGGG
ncbi:MAG: sulfur carrier protein ThiS [Gammaproteobacteria bacterium]|nr:sulfur carrier protein ThiS [Gammaproteobacteria bacterium]